MSSLSREQQQAVLLLGMMGMEGQVSQRQDYGIGNHLNWLFRGEPQPTPGEAMGPFRPVAPEHPAAVILNRMWERFDREYRMEMDKLKVQNVLVLRGRKREI